MELNLSANSVSISPKSGSKVNVSVSGIDKDDVFDHFTIDDIIRQYGVGEILNRIGVQDVKTHFDLTERE